MRKKGGRQALIRAALCLENASLAVTTIFHARLFMALSDVSLRRKAMSGLGATADIGRRYGLDGSVAFDPYPTLSAPY